MAVVCLHISAFLYLLIGVGFLLVFIKAEEDAELLVFGGGTLIFCLALVVGIEVVVYGLKRRKYWAWIAALCIFGAYALSIFLPLGAFGLWGLLDSGTQKEFGLNLSKRPV
jgi:hypothetical protein